GRPVRHPGEPCQAADWLQRLDQAQRLRARSLRSRGQAFRRAWPVLLPLLALEGVSRPGHAVDRAAAVHRGPGCPRLESRRRLRRRLKEPPRELARIVRHESRVILRMTNEITRPMIGSPIGAPKATVTALPITLSDT